MTILYMLLAIIIGSAISLGAGVLLLRIKKYRKRVLLLMLPFAAGALLAAATFDLLPEAFELGEPEDMLLYMLGGFLFFFSLERLAGWFHRHHEHEAHQQGARQRWLIVLGDIAHNAIDGIAIGAAFLVSIPTGIITTLAVAAHEVPKELGTFALLASRGWRDKVVILANVATALATVVAALTTFTLFGGMEESVGPLLAVTAGFFIYIAASDIIPDIHEQPRKAGTIQALMLLIGVGIVATIIHLLSV